MSITQIIPELINQTQPPVLPVSLIKTETLTVIKNELPEPGIVEIGIDDILNSSDEEIIPDTKDMDIVPHVLCEDSIKSEFAPENILETKHVDSVETQVFGKIGNAPLVKTENITQSESLNKTEGISDTNFSRGIGQGVVVEVQDSNDHFNALSNSKTDKQLVLEFSKRAKHVEKTDFAECYKTAETTSPEKDKAKIKVIKAPVSLVESHEYTSLAKDKLVCNHCQHTSKRLKQLKLHIRKIHREFTTMYQCPYCSYKSKWKKNVQLHIMQKHKDAKDIQWFQCHLCNMKFKLKYNLSQHMLVHFTHEQMQGQLKICPICGKAFKRARAAKNHLRFVHNKEDRSKVERKCPECEYTTTKIKLLKHHIKSTHKKPEKRFCCEKCAFTCRKNFHLKLHVLTHKPKTELDERDLKYRCDKCDYKTYRNQDLKRHKLNHLKPEEVRCFYCYHCPYKSKRRNCFQSHVWKHFRNEDVQFHCYICDFMTLKRDLITEHIKKHATLKLRELPREAEIEIDDRHLKYRCDKCKYKTYRRENFRKHILIHLKPEDIQYFYCYHCPLKCKRKDQLKTHIFRHFKKEEIKFQCYICDFMTLKRDLITEHIKEHSKVQVKPETKEES